MPAPCDVNLGKNTKLALGTEQVARINTMSITINGSNVDITELGDDWAKHCITMLDWEAAVTGYLDLTDPEQNTLHSIAISGGMVDDIRFYDDATNYWTPDTATDAEAKASIPTYNWSSDISGIVTFAMSFKGNGPIWRTS
jgi:hypothetical protein